MNIFPSKIISKLFYDSEVRCHELSYLFWECTTRCNLKCLHCGSDCSSNSAYCDMPLTDFLAALDTIQPKAKNFIVVLTGGEPLLRKDILDCGREIRKRGVRWGMVSNGFLYNSEMHNALLNAGMGALTLSLDGMSANHNWLRNNKNSFEKVDHAIELAATSKRLNFDVVTCVNRHNINELAEIYSYLKNKGVKAWRLFTIAPIGRAKHDPDLSLTDWEFLTLLDFISEKRKEKFIDVKFSCEGYTGPYERKVRDSRFFCRAGINIGSILIDGTISACPNINRNFIQGNIYQDRFFDVWTNKFQAFRNRSWNKKGKCLNCSEYKHCRGNGMHYRAGMNEEVLLCHYQKIKKAQKLKQLNGNPVSAT